MAFLSTKIVPSTTGCIGTASPFRQMEFASLKKIMEIGWKTSAYSVSISGSYSETIPGFYTTTFDDSGSGTTQTAQFKMSELNCNQRLLYTWSVSLPFSYTSTNPFDPSGTVDVPVFIAMDFSVAQKNQESYWFLNSYAGVDVCTTTGDIGPIGRISPVAGECFIDDIKVSNLYLTPQFESTEITILRNYIVEFTSIQENTPE